MFRNLEELHEQTNTIANGEISILSIGRGDIKINFNSDDPEEVEKARMTVMDMLKRGYMIFIEVNGKQIRVKDFDPKTNEYIVKIDKRTSLWKERNESSNKESSNKESSNKESSNKENPAKKAKKSITERIEAKKTKGTAIAPTGGG